MNTFDQFFVLYLYAEDGGLAGTFNHPNAVAIEAKAAELRDTFPSWTQKIVKYVRAEETNMTKFPDGIYACAIDGEDHEVEIRSNRVVAQDGFLLDYDGVDNGEITLKKFSFLEPGFVLGPWLRKE